MCVCSVVTEILTKAARDSRSLGTNNNDFEISCYKLCRSIYRWRLYIYILEILLSPEVWDPMIPLCIILLVSVYKSA